MFCSMSSCIAGDVLGLAGYLRALMIRTIPTTMADSITRNTTMAVTPTETAILSDSSPGVMAEIWENKCHHGYRASAY